MDIVITWTAKAPCFLVDSRRLLLEQRASGEGKTVYTPKPSSGAILLLCLFSSPYAKAKAKAKARWVIADSWLGFLLCGSVDDINDNT